MSIRIVTVTGASGAGKTSTIRAVLEARPEWRLLPSLTTRESRSTDLPGEYVYGVPPEKIEAMWHAGQLQWRVEHHGHQYATARRDILDALSGDAVRLMPIDPEAAQKVRDLAGSFGHRQRVLHVYVTSPPEAVLRARLQRRVDRGDMTVEEVERRVRECADWDARASVSDLPYAFVSGDIPLAEASERLIAGVDKTDLLERAELRFEAIFRENVNRRSRSAKGKDEGGKSSSKKKPMLLQGEALKSRVAMNMMMLFDDVKACDAFSLMMAPTLRRTCERWYDIANDGLYGSEAYAEEFAALETAARRFSAITGEEHVINRRYRIWSPAYLLGQVSPVLLEEHMRRFYGKLALRCADFRSRIYLDHDDAAARLLAYADVMMDGELHPWLDGCGRVSTALVMAIARVLHLPLPLFGPREEHYATIQDPEGHVAYFRRCFERARNEMP